MPVYEYQCRECQATFEGRLSFSQAGFLPPCPVCHGQQVERLISSFVAFSREPGGAVKPLGGSACSTCPLTNCSACSIARR